MYKQRLRAPTDQMQIPRLVTLTLRYHQSDAQHKQMVSGEVEYDAWSDVPIDVNTDTLADAARRALSQERLSAATERRAL